MFRVSASALGIAVPVIARPSSPSIAHVSLRGVVRCCVERPCQLGQSSATTTAKEQTAPAIQSGVRLDLRIERTVVVQRTVGRPARARQSANASFPPRVGGPSMAASGASDSGLRLGSRSKQAEMAAASGAGTSGA